MIVFTVRSALIKALCRCKDSKKSRLIIFIAKRRERWEAGLIRKEAELPLIHNSNINHSNNINRNSNINRNHSHNNIIRKHMAQSRLTKFIQMLDRDFIPILMRFRLRLITHNMMSTNITSHLLTHMAWSKAGRHQIVPLIQGNL